MTIHWRGLAALGVMMVACAGGTVRAADDAEFTIMPWELLPRATQFDDEKVGLTSIKECGFTTASFVLAEQLPTCRKLGLKAIVRWDPPGSKANEKWTDLTDEQIEQRVRGIIGSTANDDTVTGYFLRDEPGVVEFPALAKAVALVKKLAPGKLAYINLFPDYATLGAPNLSQLGTPTYTEYLERYVKEVRPQFISYDNYRVLSSGDLTNPKLASSYFRNLLEVRRVAREHNLPFWNIVTGNEIRKTTPIPSPANMLLHGYTTLAAGGKGLTWFTYYSGPYRYAAVTKDGSRTATWSYMRMVNDQVRVIGNAMKGLRNTGVYFIGDVPGAEGMALPGQWTKELKSDGPAMVGEFEGQHGDHYAIVVNLSLEHSTRMVVKLISAGEMKQVSPVDGSTLPLDDGEAVWLVAGQGVLLKLP